MKNILSTGGLGAIGKNLIKILNNKFDCNILVVDNLSSENKKAKPFVAKQQDLNWISKAVPMPSGWYLLVYEHI